ncbi:MAG TPA: class I SAM-dependent methyltransferase [bacterium]|nr:class I SAM-dependent methyltransferase [bacterium]
MACRNLIRRHFAEQLIRPHGLVGRWIIGPLWNRRNRVLNDKTLQALRLREHEQVLEIGFGGGRLLAQMAKIVTHGHLSGLDASPIMVNRVRRKFQALVYKGIMDIRLGSAEKLPFTNSAFDKVASVNAIFYWRDPARGIREACRVLRPAGLFVLTFTAKEDLDRQEFGIPSFYEDEVISMLRKAGFYRIDVSRDRDAHRAFLILTAEK